MKMYEERRIKIKRMRQENPCATLRQIGDRYGVTNERVRQILSEDGLSTIGYREPRLFICMNCGKPTKNKKWCNRKCQGEYKRIPLECPVCGDIFYRLQSEVLSRLTKPQSGNGKVKKHFYCSRKCLGTAQGRDFGFGAHPRTAAVVRFRNMQKSKGAIENIVDKGVE